jgi:hypothetical protein
MAALGIALEAVSFATGCEDEPEKRGQLMITFQTDMALPSQIDNVRVRITSMSGAVAYYDDHALGGAPDDRPMPGTLAFTAGEDTEPFRITVTGGREGQWRTYREVVTPAPRDFAAELRMPLQWLCNDSAKPDVTVDDDGREIVAQVCAEGETCKAGECLPSDLDMPPAYDAKKLYGGAKEPQDGKCFDVIACMSAGATAEPSPDCTIEKPAGGDVNVALRVANGGICNEGTTTTCFVPLDGEDPEGWTTTEDGERVQLPAEVCRRIDERRVLAVQVSSACEMKTPALPPCASWSVVPDTRAIVPDEPGIVPELFGELSLDGGKLCCPLLSEGNRLFTCFCTGTLEDGDASSVVFAVDMQTKQRESYPVGGWHTTTASVISDETLYWAGETLDVDGVPRSQLVQLPLAAGAVPTSTPGTGGLYTKGTALADASGVHFQTSGVNKVGRREEAVVYLLHYSRDGRLTSMDPLGSRAVFQIAQDAEAFYAVNNQDQASDSEMFRRVSSVVRIDKQTHRSSILLNPQTLEIGAAEYGGYIGLASDGSDVFSLFQSAPTQGRERLQIGRVTEPGNAGPSDLMPIYELEVPAAPRVTALRLLGALDGAVFFAREESFEGGRFSASVMMIRRGEARAEYLADFSGDAPEAGIVANDERVFWLNKSGRIFAFPREALAP